MRSGIALELLEALDTAEAFDLKEWAERTESDLFNFPFDFGGSPKICILTTLFLIRSCPGAYSEAFDEAEPSDSIITGIIDVELAPSKLGLSLFTRILVRVFLRSFFSFRIVSADFPFDCPAFEKRRALLRAEFWL